MHIDSYKFGKMVVNNKEYTNDLIIFPDRIKSNWWREQGHSLSVKDLEEVIEYKPDILVIGKGASGLMDVPDTTRQELEKKGIKIEAENTDQAYRIFNKQLKKNKKIVGAFHLTC